MTALLSKLRESGRKVGIVSSSQRDLIERVLRDNGLAVDFIHAGSRFFGKARAIKEMLAQGGFRKSSTLYIGDELRDVEACKRVDIVMIGVGWGMNDASSLRDADVDVASTPEELFSMITALE